MAELCDYGCGQEAIHQFKNNKWCCSKDTNQCPGTKHKISIGMKFKKPWNQGLSNIYSQKTLKQMKESHLGENNYWFGKKLSSSHKQHISKAHEGKTLTQKHRNALSLALKGNKNIKGHKHDPTIYNTNRLSIEKIKNRYPLFSQIEEMRYNPDKPGEKEIQVRCKNHNCPNSKEQGGWFVPTYIQLYERIRQIEKNGGDLCYFYCSAKCKNECPLYNSRGNDPFKDPLNIKSYTHEEYNTWKEIILEQDNYECQKCGSKKNLHCHHIIPIKLEPIFSLDPNNGIVLCENCHYKYGHKTGTECSTGNLANKKCKRKMK